MTEGSEQQGTPKRARKACTECRQQKAKCDAYLNQDGEPCSRCKRMKINCVISDPFKREHKRKRLSELEKETENLRRQLVNPRLSTELTSPTAPSLALSHGSSGTPVSAHPTPFHAVPERNGSAGYDGRPMLQPIHDMQTPVHTPDYSSHSTSDQVLEDTRVAGRTIEEIFKLYFNHFHRYMKVLDPSMPPNAYYAESPLLFWCIIGTACRNYPRDTKLLYSLAPKIINLALTTLQRQTTVQTVKALLLLLTWPFPKGAHDSDIPYPLAGAMLHVSMQIGLHIPASSQDFSRVKLRLAEAEVNERADIWARVVITYHRCSSFVGQNPMTVLDKSHDPEQVFHLTERLSPSLKYQLMLHRIEARCCDALLENGLRKLPPDRERTLNILIRVFETQLGDIEQQAPTDMARLCHTISRLTIQMFHFFKEPNEKEAPSFSRVYTSSCRVIELIDGLEQDKTKLAYCPKYLTWGILLATAAILRLLKSWFVRYLEYDHAKAKLFHGLEMAKYLSVGHQDSYTKLVPVITQLWGSDKAFKRPDGSEFSALRIRSRMIMSPVADVLWWWREEFGGQAGAYPITDDTEKKPQVVDAANPIASNIDSTLLGPQSSSHFDWMQPYYFLDDQLFAEFGLNLENPGVGGVPLDTAYGSWAGNTNVNGFGMNSVV